MSTTKVKDHWAESVVDYILEQFKGAVNWQAILKSVIDEYTYAEGEIWKLACILDFNKRVKGEIPEGSLLDFIAGILGIKRLGGENDQDFYERFKIELSQNNSGTPDYAIYNAKILSGDQIPIYHEEVDAVFFVYTPHGRQLLRSQVRRLAPAGVLGLPGATLKFVDIDKPILTNNNKRILTVARDAARGT